VLHTALALLVVVVGFPGGRRELQDLGALEPLMRVLFAGELAVTLAQRRSAERRIGRQPGKLAELVGVDLVGEDRVVRQ